MTLDFQDNSFDVSKGVTSEYVLPVATTTTLGGVKIDGSTITIDNEVISAPSANGYLPAGTVISVETDGTGDFTKLSDALNYLTGKWSNGSVKIQLGSGTFIEAASYSMNGKNFNIPNIEIAGNGINNTIVKFTTAEGSVVFTLSNINNIYIHDLKFKHDNGSSSTRYWGIYNTEHTKAVYSNCAFDGLANALLTTTSSIVQLSDSISITNARAAIAAQYGGTVVSQGLTLNVSDSLGAVGALDGGRVSMYNLKATVSNTDKGIQVLGGGLVQLSNPTLTFTNVTTPCNVTPNTITANGIAMGFTLT